MPINEETLITASFMLFAYYTNYAMIISWLSYASAFHEFIDIVLLFQSWNGCIKELIK